MNAPETIEITVNGRSRHVPAETTIASLLSATDMPGTCLAVELNEEVVPREQHDARPVRPGDRVEIVTLVGGG